MRRLQAIQHWARRNGDDVGTRAAERGAYVLPRRAEASPPYPQKDARTGGLPANIPTVSRTLLGWFTWYSRRYLRRHFHALRVSLANPPAAAPGLPLVIYANHASWWDPLVCLVLKAEFFPDRTAFAPIDAAMLARYKFFGRLGFFGVEQQTTRGAVQFLRTGEAILQAPQHLLALTPQSRFADVRQRPVRFAAGLGHLAARVQRARFVPIALEYVFWEERLPEILVRFGAGIEVPGPSRGALGPDGWTRRFAESLAETQDALAQKAQRRRPQDFITVLRGGAGQGGVYDLWRWCQARWCGRNFRREHGLL